MVGRERELEAGAGFLEALACGSRSLVLEGEAGIGKTAVWREILGQAQNRGCRVLSCRPAAAEAKLSFAGLADLLSGVEGHAFARLPAPQGHALEVALLEAAPGAYPSERRAVFAGFCSVLFGLAEQSPVLVGVDDLQWLDRPTQAALEFGLRRLGQHPIGFICAVRVGDSAVVAPGLARALDESGPERVRLGPLSVAALHRLIEERLGRGLARPTMVRIAAAARGNPFHALEIAREVARRGELSAGDALPVPEDLSELVAVRIRRLPRPTRDQLLAAAALSTPSVELLDRAALATAEEAGLIHVGQERVSFSHPLFASAVYASASASRRRELHRRLAQLVSDPEQRARHLALGAEEPSEEIALELERAAERAVLRGAAEAAAELLELAVRLTPSGSVEHGPMRAVAAAECHFHAGDRARSRSLAEQVLSRSTGGPVRGHALRVPGEVRYHEDSFVEAVPLFEEALTLIGNERRAVELHLNLAFAHLSLSQLPAAARHAQAAVERATVGGDNSLLAAALAMSAITDFRLGQPLDRARIELALALEDPDRQLVMPMRPARLAGIAEYLSDNLERAASLFALLRQRTIDRGEDSHLPMLNADLSLVERSRGNLHRALEFATEGCEIARSLGSRTAQADMLGERSSVRAALGDVEGARSDIEEALALGRETDVGYAAFWLGGALAFLELSLGNARVASEALEPLGASVEASGWCSHLAAVLVPDKIEALVALGELERAEALTTMLERHGRAHDRPSALGHAARCRALLAGARGDVARAKQEAEQALLEHARVQMPLELGRTLLVKGQIERRSKQKRAARESFERALEIFERIGARPWALRARSELERTGVRHTEGDELTPTELRVAELAAQGLTNKRIAETSFLSVKTVEANLARIYRKLGIRSRAELGRAMAERDRADFVPPAVADRG